VNLKTRTCAITKKPGNESIDGKNGLRYLNVVSFVLSLLLFSFLCIFFFGYPPTILLLSVMVILFWARYIAR